MATADRNDGAELDAFLSAHAPVKSDAHFAAGTVVGDWRLTGFLGRGGSSEVYRAVHAVSSKAAAVKMLLRDDAAARARFDREARFVNANEDAAFPRCLGAGEYEGRPFVAMELLEPMELPCTDGAVADYILAVAASVAVLHSQGLVHRDLKPQNVMRRENGDLVIIDFGLLKPFSMGAEDRLPLSISVVAGKAVGVGTPRYSAPEQFGGGDITPAADIHALGAIVDECFKGNLPRCWERIVRRATSSIPGQRYRDIAAFMHAVRTRHRVRHLLTAAVFAAAVALAATAVILRVESNLAKKSEEDRLMQERIDREHEEIREMLQRDVY